MQRRSPPLVGMTPSLPAKTPEAWGSSPGAAAVSKSHYQANGESSSLRRETVCWVAINSKPALHLIHKVGSYDDDGL